MASTARAQAHLPIYYDVIEIVVPGALYAFGSALNDQQQAVFEWGDASGNLHGGRFDYVAGTTIDIGSLGGNLTEPLSINNAGDIAGWSSDASDHNLAFIYQNGVIRSLGALPTSSHSVAWDINDSGYAVGWSTTSPAQNYPEQAVSFANGTVSALAPANSQAHAVNAFGDSVGFISDTNGLHHAALFSNGTITDINLPGYQSLARDINDSGDIVGYEANATTGQNARAFIYSGGARTDLGTLPGATSTYSSAINNYGLVVGSSGGLAYVYGDCRMMDLTSMIGSNSLYKGYVTLEDAADLSNNGWILANGHDTRDQDGAWHTYLLRPMGKYTQSCT